MSKKTYRIQFKFWLDAEREDEAALIDEIQILKKSREFSRTVRDGIRLIASLRRGELDVLLELFPWVKSALQDETPTHPSPQMPLLLDNQLDLLADRLQLRLAQSGGLARPRPIAQPQPAAEDLLEIKAAQDGGKSAQNFIDKLYGLQGWSNPPKLKPSSPNPTQTTGNPKAMDVAPIPPPSFDDLNLDL